MNLVREYAKCPIVAIDSKAKCNIDHLKNRWHLETRIPQLCLPTSILGLSARVPFIPAKANVVCDVAGKCISFTLGTIITYQAIQFPSCRISSWKSQVMIPKLLGKASKASRSISQKTVSNIYSLSSTLNSTRRRKYSNYWNPCARRLWNLLVAS